MDCKIQQVAGVTTTPATFALAYRHVGRRAGCEVVLASMGCRLARAVAWSRPFVQSHSSPGRARPAGPRSPKRVHDRRRAAESSSRPFGCLSVVREWGRISSGRCSAVGLRRHLISTASGDRRTRRPPSPSLRPPRSFDELLAREGPKDEGRDPGDIRGTHVAGSRSRYRAGPGGVCPRRGSPSGNDIVVEAPWLPGSVRTKRETRLRCLASIARRP